MEMLTATERKVQSVDKVHFRTIEYMHFIVTKKGPSETGREV